MSNVIMYGSAILAVAVVIVMLIKKWILRLPCSLWELF